MWGIIVVALVVGWYSADLPDIESVTALQRRPGITLIGMGGENIATYGDVYGDPVQLGDLPPYLPQAVIATEDRRFYSHFGIDVFGMVRAAVINLRAGHVVQGASTLTQQMAKNLFLTSDRNFKRKIQEMILALLLEHRFTKDQLLTLYLNRIYLGNGTYGVEAAARRYFGCSARQLTLYQAAMLAGLPKAPSRFNPASDPKAADRRTRQVLQNMVNAEMLLPAQAQAVQASAVEATAAAQVPIGRYFGNWVKDQVASFIGPIDRDLVVMTTLDPTLQRESEQALAALMDSGAAVKARVGQGAIVVMSPDGAVRTMIGGHDYGESPFNRATQAARPPGSAFKPFVYLAGLEAGLAPSSTIEAAPVRVGHWSPKNFSHRFEGPVTLSHALAHSINTVAVRIAQRAGLDHVVQVARRLGINMPKHVDMSVVLGTSEVSLVDLTAAYAVFANGGQGVLPYGIVEIRDRDGQVLYHRSGGGPGRLVSAAHAGAMNQMMAGVITGGTGKKAALNRPAAGKSGTTQDFHDAWFMGFTADYVAGVWLGNDDNAHMKDVTGGSLPAALWHDVMMAAHRNLPPRPLAETGGVAFDTQVASPASASAPSELPASDSDSGMLDRLIEGLFGR
ncbi:MAG: PBP1A family penicillin-binding protein [Alphaproteobacteria bacterium]|nr:PBP1A family penicillin-binding protein [Alphaproteobacteria bacterium]